MDELEEFSEAPHVVNNCSISSSSRDTLTNPPSAAGEGVNTATVVKANGGGGHNYRNSHSNQNGYSKRTAVMGNGGGVGHRAGGVNLMDDLVGVSDEDEDDSEEVVINEFRRPGSYMEPRTVQQQQNQRQNGTTGKVMLNGTEDECSEDEYEGHNNKNNHTNEDDYEYEHISLSEDGLVDERSGKLSVLGGDISTDLLHCDDNDSDLLILTKSGRQRSSTTVDDSYRMFVQS